jgi:hypothetical protein
MYPGRADQLGHFVAVLKLRTRFSDSGSIHCLIKPSDIATDVDDIRAPSDGCEQQERNDAWMHLEKHEHRVVSL